MGSPNKFSISWMKGIGLGIHIDDFPHEISINIWLIKVHVYIGFGKGYDE